MKLARSGIFFVGMFLATNSIFLIDIGLFRLSVYSLISIGKFLSIKELSVSFKLSNLLM